MCTLPRRTHQLQALHHHALMSAPKLCDRCGGNVWAEDSPKLSEDQDPP